MEASTQRIDEALEYKHQQKKEEKKMKRIQRLCGIGQTGNYLVDPFTASEIVQHVRQLSHNLQKCMINN